MSIAQPVVGSLPVSSLLPPEDDVTRLLPGPNSASAHLAERLAVVPAVPGALIVLGLLRREDTGPTGASGLAAATAVVARSLRGEHWLGRSGPDEFAVLLSGTAQDAEVAGARLATTITELDIRARAPAPASPRSRGAPPPPRRCAAPSCPWRPRAPSAPAASSATPAPVEKRRPQRRGRPPPQPFLLSPSPGRAPGAGRAAAAPAARTATTPPRRPAPTRSASRRSPGSPEAGRLPQRVADRVAEDDDQQHRHHEDEDEDASPSSLAPAADAPRPDPAP